MGRHQVRLLVCALASIALILASTLVIEWFRATIALNAAAVGPNVVKIDLRSISACQAGVCVSFPMSMLTGLYPTVATVAFWSSVVLAAIVAFQAGSRLLGGSPGGLINSLGFFAALIGVVTALFAGYFFGPQTGANAAIDLSVTRAWGPVALVAGNVLAMASLYFATTESLDYTLASTPRPAHLPVAMARPAVARAAAPAAELGPRGRVPDSIPLDDSPVEFEPHAGAQELPVRTKSPTASPDVSVRVKSPTADVGVRMKSPTAAPDVGVRMKSPTAAPDVGVRMKTPTAAPELRGNRPTAPPIQIDLPPPRPRRPSGLPFDDPAAMPGIELPSSLADALPADAPPLRGMLRYAVSSADLSGPGIDARLDDGSTRLVRWADVVGIVARRLPPTPPFDGATFIDLVSTPGATLRILPWTQVTGAAAPTDDRARALVQLFATRCSGAKLDGATRTFLGSRGPAPQLPDAATLATHDARLA
jgi:hypothetical protein